MASQCIDNEYKSRGFCEPGFEKVAQVFKADLGEFHQRGGAFAVFHRGQLVVNLFGGFADTEASFPWQDDTLTPLYSATKGITAYCLAICADRGWIDYDIPVSHYWPEFAQNGKGDITVQQLVSHQAAIPIIETNVTLKLVRDHVKMGEALAKSVPLWKPDNETFAYHAFSWGFYIDQLIRRVDPEHRSVGAFAREEIFQPFGLDLHLGMNKTEQCRLARSYALPRPPPPPEWATKEQIQTKMKTYTNPMFFANTAMYNRMDLASSEIPSGNGCGTAAGLAKLAMVMSNNGKLDGKTMMGADTISRLRQPLVKGTDYIMMLPISRGLGVEFYKNPRGQLMMGHGGLGGQIVVSDFENECGIAYVTNDLQFGMTVSHKRFNNIINAVYECLP